MPLRQKGPPLKGFELRGSHSKLQAMSCHHRKPVAPPCSLYSSTRPIHPEEWWAKTMQWRAATDVESVLSRPQPHFDVIKQNYEHFIAGRDKLGHPVYVDVIKVKRVSTLA